MPVRANIRLRDPSDGSVTHWLSDDGDFEAFAWSARVNRMGQFRIDIPGISLAVLDKFGLDTIVEFRRRITSDLTGELVKDWYTPFWGFHRTRVASMQSVRVWDLSSYGPGVNELLARRWIWWKAGSSGAEKSGPVETVMKEYVNENLGPGALVSAGRAEEDGVQSGVSIATDGGGGPTWSGSRAYKALLPTLQNIAAATGADFKMIMTPDPLGYEFEVYPTGIGADRSKLGLDRSTGLNGAGNTPIIFTTEDGSVRNVTYSENAGDEENAILVAGQGQKSIRSTTVEKDAARISASPLNRREGVLQANQQDDSTKLGDIGAAELEKRSAEEKISFEINQTERKQFDVDYFLGDIVAVEIPELDIDLRLRFVGVTCTFDDGGEDLDHDFEEVIS